MLFAYDGSELAELAIEQAGRELAPGRDALVVCASGSRPTSASSPSTTGTSTPQNATEVQEAAEETAAHGAALAEKAGFEAQSLAVEAAPTWKGIVKTAEEHQASLIVLGSHRRKRPHRAPGRQRCRRRRRALADVGARRAPAPDHRAVTP